MTPRLFIRPTDADDGTSVHIREDVISSIYVVPPQPAPAAPSTAPRSPRAPPPRP